MPYYLAIGMTYELFWQGPPYLVKAYREAHEFQREIENQRLWLQGLYNYRAFAAVMENFAYGMNGKKGSKPQGYLDNPIAITEAERKAEKKRKIKHTLAWVNKGNQ